jgi:hypothetical protein
LVFRVTQLKTCMASEVLHRLWHEKFSAGAADAADAAGDCITRLLSEVPHDVLAECPLPILFLYMKNVLADGDVEDRVRAVCRIATGPGPSPSPSSPSRKWTLAHLCHQRLMALVRNMNGDVTWDGPGSGPAPPAQEGLATVGGGGGVRGAPSRVVFAGGERVLCEHTCPEAAGSEWGCKLHARPECAGALGTCVRSVAGRPPCQT